MPQTDQEQVYCRHIRNGEREEHRGSGMCCRCYGEEIRRKNLEIVKAKKEREGKGH